MLSSRFAARPRRTLLIVFLFVIVAGALGGPVAGALKSSGGFVAPGADSEVAIDRVEAATGLEPDAGLVPLVASPTATRLDAVAKRVDGIPGVASATPGGRAGERGIVTA